MDVNLPLIAPPLLTFPLEGGALHTSSFDPTDFASEPAPIAYTSTALMPWPPSLPRDLALGGLPLDDILSRYAVTLDDYNRWAQMPVFRRALSDAQQELVKHGASFRALCQGIALDFLPDIDATLHSPTISFAAKMDAFKYVSKCGHLEPKEEKSSAGGNVPMVNIQINL